MVEKIKKICFDVATLGGMGEWQTGGLVATIAVVPLLFILKALAYLGTTFFTIVIIALALFVLLVIQGALRYETDKDSSVIVIDRLFGCLLLFLGIPFSVKIFIIGFLLFNFLRFLSPFLCFKLGMINFEELPGPFGVLASDVIIGLMLNVLFRLIFWIVR